LEEEDLYGKAESEFWSIINAEKKNIEKKKEAEMDKADAGKVNLPCDTLCCIMSIINFIARYKY